MLFSMMSMIFLLEGITIAVFWPFVSQAHRVLTLCGHPSSFDTHPTRTRALARGWTNDRYRCSWTFAKLFPYAFGLLCSDTVLHFTFVSSMFYVTVHFWFELSTPVHMTFGVVPLSPTVMFPFLFISRSPSELNSRPSSLRPFLLV